MLTVTKSYNNSTGILTVTLKNEDDSAYNGTYFWYPAVVAILGLE